MCIRDRGSFDFPVLGVAASLSMDGSKVSAAQLVLGAVHTHPVSVDLAHLLLGRTLTDDRLLAVADAAFKAATPLDNTDLMYAWRKKMVRVEVRRAFQDLATRAN